MQSTSVQHRHLRRPSPPRRHDVSTPPSLSPSRDCFVPAQNTGISWRAAVLAGASLLGTVSCSNTASPEVQLIAWPEGNFSENNLAEISLQHDVATSAEMTKAVDWALKQNLQLAPPRAGETRHDLGRRVQTGGSDTVQYDGSDIVVIAFEGTGGYHPRKARVITDAAARLREQGLRVDGNSGSLSALVSRTIDNSEGRSSGWSGLSRGPLEELVRDPELSSRTQWLSFASEEVEALSSLGAFKKLRLSEVVSDSYDSYTGQTPGIENALKAVGEIRQQARALGKEPRFLLVSHSSGGRSMVKFLERAKATTEQDGERLQFPAAVMIDPVREAHEAFFEGGRELMARGTQHNLNRVRESVGLPSQPVDPPLVRHRSQPESLYRPSNLTTLLNFFQRQDTEGLKIRPLVGIQGSPVERADNVEIIDVGSGGHGEIAIHPKVRDAFMDTLQNLADQSGESQTTP